MAEETFRVSGITCQGCERTIRTLVSEVDGVEQVHANRHSNTVTVVFDATRVTRDDLKKELPSIGYAVWE